MGESQATFVWSRGGSSPNKGEHDEAIFENVGFYVSYGVSKGDTLGIQSDSLSLPVEKESQS